MDFSNIENNTLVVHIHKKPGRNSSIFYSTESRIAVYKTHNIAFVLETAGDTHFRLHKIDYGDSYGGVHKILRHGLKDYHLDHHSTTWFYNNWFCVYARDPDKRSKWVHMDDYTTCEYDDAVTLFQLAIRNYLEVKAIPVNLLIGFDISKFYKPQTYKPLKLQSLRPEELPI